MKSFAVYLTTSEWATIVEALDSHVYWQLSEDRERNDGFVYYPESGSEEYQNASVEDQERWQEMNRVESLSARLSKLIESETLATIPYDEHSDHQEEA